MTCPSQQLHMDLAVAQTFPCMLGMLGVHYVKVRTLPLTTDAQSIRLLRDGSALQVHSLSLWQPWQSDISSSI